jgi:hypothetical protein
MDGDEGLAGSTRVREVWQSCLTGGRPGHEVARGRQREPRAMEPLLGRRGRRPALARPLVRPLARPLARPAPTDNRPRSRGTATG